MKKLLLLLSLFPFLACSTSGQAFENKANSRPTISVDAVGKVTVPADIIQFQIQLTRYNESARAAFHAHKELEEFLTELLLEEGISSENIKTEPIGIHSRSRGEQYGFQTSQSVILNLDNIDKFEVMQLILIENNFDTFSGQFSSSKVSGAEDEALAKAMAEAERQAKILAEAAGRSLGDIQSIYHSGSPSPFPAARMEMSYDASGGSLLQFEQSVPVQKNVQVVFELE
ncbi:MAG: SIMPL domain-containing protein [Balneolaceae bacterium]